jgi:hypothetical protein
MVVILHRGVAKHILILSSPHNEKEPDNCRWSLGTPRGTSKSVYKDLRRMEGKNGMGHINESQTNFNIKKEK